MKVLIEAESQAEFDSKREDLIKAIAGQKLNVRIARRERSRYDDEKPTMTPRKPRYRAQAEVLAHFNEIAKREFEEMKREIGAILG